MIKAKETAQPLQTFELNLVYTGGRLFVFREENIEADFSGEFQPRKFALNAGISLPLIQMLAQLLCRLLTNSAVKIFRLEKYCNTANFDFGKGNRTQKGVLKIKF